VADHLEIRGPHGERLLVPVGQGSFVVGSAADADVRVEWPGIADRQFRFVRTDGGVRIEPVRGGSTVAINGEELFCKDLRSGDRIEVGNVHLRWLPDAPAAQAVGPVAKATRPVARSAAVRPEPAASRRARRRGVPTNALVALVFVALLVAAFVAYRVLSGSTWPTSPQRYVDLARTQMENGNYQASLDTLAFAMRDATGATRTEAQQLDTTIRKLMLETAETPKIVAARSEHDLLLGYVGRYLRDGSTRPAAREFVRLCDAWLRRHAEVCARVSDGKPLLQAIEDQRARHVPLAALQDPDVAADVIFAARTMLRFQWRDYRGAVARLDAFLAASPGAEAVRAERAAIVAEGEQWFAGKLRLIDMLLGRGDTDNAAEDIAQLERWSALPEWEPQLAERKRRLAGPR